MSEKIQVWKPIDFTDNWLETDTSLLDDIAPSWFAKREEISDDSSEFKEFMERLKRHHAIETGVVEKLYDLNEGITQTFIKKGFAESIIQYGDTNINPPDLIKFLKDHYSALDLIFDYVKEDRELTKGFILELHQLVTANQEYTTAIDSLGTLQNIPLLKGKFKVNENNPRREDGTIFQYCPPIHVESEIEKLIDLYNKLENKSIKPIIISAWFHHAFTQIHPFQDGNGRIARLLATMILVKHSFFPFTVKRGQKPDYIDALENADQGDPNDIVKFFSRVQKKNIEEILNEPFEAENKSDSLQSVASKLSFKLHEWQEKQKKLKQQQIKENRDSIFEYIYECIGSIFEQLRDEIDINSAEVFIDSNLPDSPKYYWYTKQIAEYATHHKYYFNKNLPRGWFKFVFSLPDERKYEIIITVHHYGYSSDTIALGAFMEYYPPEHNNDKDADIIYTPFDLHPHTISLGSSIESLKPNISSYLSDIVTVGLTQIMNEFY